MKMTHTNRNTLQQPRTRRASKKRSRTGFFGRSSTLIGVLSALVLSVPLVASAQELVGDFVFYWLAPPVYAYVLMIGNLMWVMGSALSFLLNASFDVVNYLPVTVGWQTTRDVVNMAVVLILLVVIFATLFRVEAYYKNVLPKLVVAVILVNLSRTITSVLIEISNIFTRSLMPAPFRGNFSEAILGAIGIQDFWSIQGDKKFTSLDAFTGLLFNAVIFTLIFLAFLGIVLLFLFRLIALMLLTILAPLAFVMGVLPATKKYASMWWQALVKWIIYGPVAAFFLLLAIRVAETERDQIIKGAIGNYQQPFVQESSIGSIFVSMVIIALIFASLITAQKLGVFGAGAAMKLSQYGASYLGRSVPQFLRATSIPNLARQSSRFASRAAGRLGLGKLQGGIDAARVLGDRVARGIDNQTVGRLERTALGRQLQGLGLTDVMRGNLGTFAGRAPLLPQALLQRMSRTSDEYYGPARGDARDAINRLFGEETNLGDAERAKRAKANLEGLTGEELVSRLGETENFEEGLAAALEAANKGELESLTENPELFNRYRDQLIGAAQANHDFSPEGMAAYERFMKSKYNDDERAALQAQLEDPEQAAAARAQINKDWKESNEAEFNDAFSVTKTSAPVYTPEIMKALLAAHMTKLAGSDTSKAARGIAQISNVMGEKGNLAAFGMAAYDPKTKTWSMRTKEQQLGAQAARVARTGKNASLKSLTPDSIAAKDAAGNVVGLNGNIDMILRNLSTSSLGKIKENSREDLRAALDTEVSIGGGQKARLHDLATDRLRNQYVNLVRAGRTATGADKQRIEAAQKKLQESFAVMLALQHASKGKATVRGPGGAPIELSIDREYTDRNGKKADVSTSHYKKIAEQFLAGVPPASIRRYP